MVICSDVIYPSGDAEDYEEKFYRPYENYPRPIYALPGNHDWYDGLNGFMYHLCDAEVPTTQGRSPKPVATGTDSKRDLWREPLRRLLWRKPSGIDPTVPTRKQAWRSAPSQRSSQRSSYFAIETGPLLIVGIDTGMSGSIDSEQGEWLRKVSRIDKPKILLTGKPIYVDGEYHPGAIEDGGTVDQIVRDPGHRYVAAIGGDIHNYQRYRVMMKDHPHPFYYIVSGGGGAYMSATHQIRKISLPGIKLAAFSFHEQRHDEETPHQRRNRRDRRHRKTIEENFRREWIAEDALVVVERVGTGQCLRGPRSFLRKTHQKQRRHRQYQNDREDHRGGRRQHTRFAAGDSHAPARRAFHRCRRKLSCAFVTLKHDQRRERDDGENHRFRHRHDRVAALTCCVDLECQHAHVAAE
jgi:hypothetical protein